ncbi:hypothetical protein [Spirosoma sp. KNUC1025]|uniref:hypothetical protein n=1 Tax=Spirosoma sp. KNUC1025 TaxID=2894082 RepID=UPI001E430598|nr:hypothetical protein [Spirosoma sp. KNUC1025]UFH57541.1 hypothetical protein LN737_31035 [Spirosoma sp. KNUC1025]
MRYTTIYDLQTQPVMDWRSLVLPFGLAIAAAFMAYYTRAGFHRSVALVFAVSFVVLPVGIQAFNYYYLTSRPMKVVEGSVWGYWRKDWTTRHDGKNIHHSQEAFRVGTTEFWYNRSQTAGFTNVEPVEYPIRDGLPVRIHYASVRQIDSDEIINMIAKLEVVAEGA